MTSEIFSCNQIPAQEPRSSIQRVAREDNVATQLNPGKSRCFRKTNQRIVRVSRAYTLRKERVLNFRGEMMFSNKTQSGRQPLILCVDDDPKGLYFRTLILEESGYKVFASAHPAQALMIIEHEFVDIALVDYQMPDMNGAELSAFIKKKTPRTRIIMLSGCSHIPEADLASVDFFVSKGDGMSRVLEIISDFLKEKRDPNKYPEGSSATTASAC